MTSYGVQVISRDFLWAFWQVDRLCRPLFAGFPGAILGFVIGSFDSASAPRASSSVSGVVFLALIRVHLMGGHGLGWIAGAVF